MLISFLKDFLLVSCWRWEVLLFQWLGIFFFSLNLVRGSTRERGIFGASFRIWWSIRLDYPQILDGVSVQVDSWNMLLFKRLASSPCLLSLTHWMWTELWSGVGGQRPRLEGVAVSLWFRTWFVVRPCTTCLSFLGCTTHCKKWKSLTDCWKITNIWWHSPSLSFLRWYGLGLQWAWYWIRTGHWWENTEGWTLSETHPLG